MPELTNKANLLSINSWQQYEITSSLGLVNEVLPNK